MKIAYITAGAGNMYCGSCLRDNTLAAALMSAGHQVLLIPTYTPTRTDERNVSYGRVFLGGINVFLQQHFALFRKTPWILDRIFDSTPLLRLSTRWGISVDPTHLGRLTVSMLRGTEGLQCKEVLKLARFLAEHVEPEIINIPNSLLIALAPAIKAETGAPVCCSLQGEDFFIDALGEPYRSESLRLIRQHSEYVDAFIAVSEYGAESMTHYLGIPRNRIQIVPLGINFDGYRKESDPRREAFTIGYLARVAPEKGLHVLCEAYRRLRTHADFGPSRLRAAGYLAPEHKSYIADTRKKLDACGLSGEFSYEGTLDREGKLAFLRGLDVFSVPGPYADPKGLFLLEAIASGIPVVQPRRGAYSEIIENTGGGILVEPDDPEALADGIMDLWRDPAKREELGRRGFEGVRTRYSADGMAESLSRVYSSILKPRTAVAATLNQE